MKCFIAKYNKFITELFEPTDSVLKIIGKGLLLCVSMFLIGHLLGIILGYIILLLIY